MTDINAKLAALLNKPTPVEPSPDFKAGDVITYSCAAGVLTATVRSVTVGATAKPGHYIPWLNITIHASEEHGRRYASDVSLPATPDNLKMYKVALAN